MTFILISVVVLFIINVCLLIGVISMRNEIKFMHELIKQEEKE